MRLNLAVLIATVFICVAAISFGVERRLAFASSIAFAALSWWAGHYFLCEINYKQVKPQELGEADALTDPWAKAIAGSIMQELQKDNLDRWSMSSKLTASNDRQGWIRFGVAILVIAGAFVWLERTSHGVREMVCTRYLGEPARYSDRSCPWVTNYGAEMAAREQVRVGEYRATLKAIDRFEIEGVDPNNPAHATEGAAWLYKRVGCYGRSEYLNSPLMIKHRVTFNNCAVWTGYN